MSDFKSTACMQKTQKSYIRHSCLVTIIGTFLAFSSFTAFAEKSNSKNSDRTIAIEASQKSAIAGIVRSTTGEALVGVTVVVKGTTNGTITDINGNFNLNSVPENGLLIVSFIGMQTQEVAVGARKQIEIVLNEDVSEIDEVVVIGYGSVSKRDLTGSIASVSGESLQKVPVANVAEAITGKLSGVQVTTTEGSPDAEIKIRVRGGGSITQDNSPLYIVDGFPANSISDIPMSDIQSIEVLKDASTTAIYGARGANGVFIVTTKSGKEGRITVNVNAYTGFRKVSDLLDVLSPYEYVLYQYELDQSQTFNNYYGLYQDLDIYKSVKGTNWQDEVFGRTALQSNYNASVSGGNKTTKFNLSLARADEESIMIGSGYQRNNMNFKLNTNINEKLSLDFNTRLAYTSIEGAGVSSGSGATTRLRNAVKYAPTRGLREFSSSVIDDDELNNPESASLLFDPVESTNDEYKVQNRLMSNMSGAINWEVIKGLKFRSEWGYEFSNNRTDNVWGPATSQSKNKAGQPIGQIYMREGQNWRTANTLNFDKKNIIEGHNINVLIGQEFTSAKWNSVTSYSEYFPSDMKADDVLAMMNLGVAYPTQTKIGQDNNLLSYFGRFIYNINDKYLMSFTFRADGSSKFAKGNQWGYFPSAALAWRLSEEDFLKSQSDWLTNLKMRLSYGAAGNNRISDGLWKMTYSTTGDKPYYTNETEDSYLIPGSTLYNPNLKWETTYTRNVGLDFGILKNIVTGTFDAYWNTTKDLLIQAPLATSSGYSYQYRNVGQTSNKGIELSLEGHLIDKKDFELNANFNISFNRNKVDVFKNGDENFKTYSSGWNGSAQPLDDYIVEEGKPVGQMYGYVTDGMYSFDDFTFNPVYNSSGEQTSATGWKINEGVVDNSALTSPGRYFGPGALKFKDISGPDGKPDGKLDAYDKTVIGDANPVHTGGFGLSGRYKSFDFSAFFNWSYGNDVYNANKLDFSTYLLTRKYQNILSIMDSEHRFTTIDPTSGNNIYYGEYANPEALKELNANASIWHPIMTLTPLHSWAIEDGSFLRLNNVTIGYTLPRHIVDRMKINNLRIYVTGYNLYTWTNYSGFDPEVDTRRSTPLTPSVDYSAYPKSFSLIAGFNLTF